MLACCFDVEVDHRLLSALFIQLRYCIKALDFAWPLIIESKCVFHYIYEALTNMNSSRLPFFFI